MTESWGGAREGAGRPRDELTTEEKGRRDVILAALLGLGPAGWMKTPDDPIVVSDEELATAWRDWARDVGPWHSLEEWPEASYAHQRFVLGLDVDAAIAAADALNVAEGFEPAPAARAWHANAGLA